jgi:hypothetical protein
MPRPHPARCAEVRLDVPLGRQLARGSTMTWTLRTSTLM